MGPQRLPLALVDLVLEHINSVIGSLCATGCASKIQGLLVKIRFTTFRQSNLFSFLLLKKKKQKTKKQLKNAGIGVLQNLLSAVVYRGSIHKCWSSISVFQGYSFLQLIVHQPLIPPSGFHCYINCQICICFEEFVCAQRFQKLRNQNVATGLWILWILQFVIPLWRLIRSWFHLQYSEQFP